MPTHLIRQIDHWRAAVHRLDAPETQAAPAAWVLLESYTGVALRSRLDASLTVLKNRADWLLLKARQGALPERELRTALQQLRQDYLQTEVTLDYFGDAVNTRTNSHTGNHLMALDFIAREAIRKCLQPMGHLVPGVMTYLDKGLGASILKAGLRLWDRRGVNPVAVIKVVRHNLYRPTALIHEAGHQIAYVLQWNEELSRALDAGMRSFGDEVAQIWGSWSSEIAADAFAFIFTGYAAVATLQDVLSGSNRMVFHFHPGDPHPVPYLRVLLGTAMCRLVFGTGPWDDLEAYWLKDYSLPAAQPSLRGWLMQAREQASAAAKIILHQPMEAFGGQSLVSFLPPDRLRPDRLLSWGTSQGNPGSWPVARLKANVLDLLALSVYQQVMEHDQSQTFRRELDAWLQHLGSHLSYPEGQYA